MSKIDRAAHAEAMGLSAATHEWFMQGRGGEIVRRMDEEIARDDIAAARVTRTALWRWVLDCIGRGTPIAGDCYCPPGTAHAYDGRSRVWAMWAIAMEIELGEAQKRLNMARDESDTHILSPGAVEP